MEERDGEVGIGIGIAFVRQDGAVGVLWGSRKARRRSCYEKDMIEQETMSYIPTICFFSVILVCAMAERANTTGASETSDPSTAPSDLKQRRRTQQSSFSEQRPDRRSSLFSHDSYETDSSFEPRPFSVRSSTQDLFSPRASLHKHEIDHETSIWHSLPLLFAIFPAIGGLLFNKGSVLITDLALLVFAAIYLNWCLVTPWYARNC